MSLPKAIQRQVDAAAAAEAAVEQQAQQAPSVLTDPSQLAPESPPTVAPQQTAEPAPVVQAPVEDWQQKYRSLQGMFAQKTGELQAQNKTYESQITQMQQQLDLLMQTRKQESAKEKQSVDPNDIESFGADMIDMVQRYAEQTFQSMAAQFGGKSAEMDRRLSALEEQVTGVATRTEVTLEQQFYATLKGLVPDWEQVNADERWLKWLAEVDPVYGAQRQTALDSARATMDAPRAANVFNAFKAAFPSRPQESLANQVAPNGAATQPPVPPAAKALLSSRFVEKFYSEVAKGRYLGKEAEAARIEAEINAAAQEGRIR